MLFALTPNNIILFFCIMLVSFDVDLFALLYHVHLSHKDAEVRLFHVFNHRIIKVTTKIACLYCTLINLFNIFYNSCGFIGI